MDHPLGSFDHSLDFSSFTKERAQCRRKFLRAFPKGFKDRKFLAWERDYKWEAHKLWTELLGQPLFHQLLQAKEFDEVARRALRVESRTNLLFSFEKMALRDAVRTADGARIFAMALYQWLHGTRQLEDRFEEFVAAVEALPRRQTRVLTWPLVSVFGFIAQPDQHLFLKPLITKRAAQAYHFPFEYTSRPSWSTYANLLEFAALINEDIADLKPRDMIDIQSFIFVLGSPFYE
ncbi:MAG: hypothetical protein ABI432_00910 [Flavobacteriales bacterium]